MQIKANQPVVGVKPVGKIVKGCEQNKVEKVIHSLETEFPPGIPIVVDTLHDAQIVLGWWKYAKSVPTALKDAGIISSQIEGLSRLGKLCVLAAAKGHQGKRCPKVVRSTSGPA